MLFPGSLCRVPSRRYWPSNLSLSCEVVENRDSFWAPNFVGVITQKSLRSVLSLTDARHVLTFLKDSFRSVDGLDYPLMNSSKISFWAPNVCIGRGHKMFYSNLLLWFIPYRVAKFGWVPSAELSVRSPAMKKNAYFWRVVKIMVLFFAASGPTFINFGTM